MINSDQFASSIMKIVYIPNYTVAILEMLVKCSDTNQQITKPGSEPSGTSNMKFIMNGSLVIGSRDGSNLEIESEIG
eukprot:CAMPEP_0170567942 /NCGR_PEP_ID=MMETSP0211-20121228/80812_1 /TAXON_ID=311385 /ORGANISM="Pseudokeronopsis sp., Strain OXSARD2" /LENGTH=76 /DNA_ID=CAMNT_0010889557 /DNA_START=274 /DNA_END=504 /DNA_ORIENTATION=+